MRGRRNKIFKKRTWAKVKQISQNKEIPIDYEEEQNGVIRAFVRRGSTEFFVNLFPPDFGHVVGVSDTNDEDYQDFVDNYMGAVDEDPPADVLHEYDPIRKTTVPSWRGPYSGDGKQRVLASHKPVIPGKESWNYFCSTGDLVASGTVGGGQPMLVECTSGTPVSQVDFEFLNNQWPSEHIYIFGGALCWENAGPMDCFNMEIRAHPTPVVPAVVASGLGLDVDYNVVDEKVVYAGPGMGSHALGGLPVMVQNFEQSGNWDLDRSTMTPYPNVSGTGNFDWHTTDTLVGHYIADLLVRGNNYNPRIIDATESAPVPYGYYFRLKCHNNSDTNWSLWGFLRMYRERLK